MATPLLHTVAVNVDTAAESERQPRAPSLVEARDLENKEEEEEGQNDSCCICLEGKEFVLTSCCHLFCLSCITRWLEISGTCPICRNDFDSGVELFNLSGTVTETMDAIKQLHKRKRELEERRRRRTQAQEVQPSEAPGWALFQQMVDLLFSSEAQDEPNLFDQLELEQDTASHLAQLQLTRVSLSGQPSQNVSLSHARAHQLHASPSFPFLSFCCLPQSSALSMSIPFDRAPIRNRIH